MPIGQYPLHVPGGETAFSAGFYVAAYPEVLQSALNPAEHFDRIGRSEGRYRSNAQLVAHELILRSSGVFDERLFRQRAQLAQHTNAAVHYLLNWRNAPEPSEAFDGRFLAPYHAEAGLAAPPAVAHGVLKDAGWPEYLNEGEALEVARLLLDSGEFDAAFYRETRRSVPRSGDRPKRSPERAPRLSAAEELEQALHYVIVGERLGLDPSPKFSVAVYARQVPVLAATGANLLQDYVIRGRSRGRSGERPSRRRRLSSAGLDQSKETILLVSHDASRTGAPILAANLTERLSAIYNVVVLLLEGGELADHFSAVSAEVVGPLTRTERDEEALAELLGHMLSLFKPRYALINSIESRAVIPSLTARFVPTVTLMHEFASLIRHPHLLAGPFESSTELVFPAPAVLSTATKIVPGLSERAVRVLPQGPCSVPGRSRTDQDAVGERERLLQEMIGSAGEDSFIVLGLGSIEFRKGVDLFIGCAAAVRRLGLERPVRFVWIGRGYRPRESQGYPAYLAEQVARSGVEEMIAFLEPVGDLEPAYERADLLFLSSRLDPMPNVAIDAGLRETPILCFQAAGGVSDMLEADPLTTSSVVPYADVHAAAQSIATFVQDEAARVRLGSETKRLFREAFDMAGYVASLDDLGAQAARRLAQREQDARTILADPDFDTRWALPPSRWGQERPEAVNGFLVRWDAFGHGGAEGRGGSLRKPFPGFHPKVYADLNRARYDSALVNPLADYIRSGKPAGPWLSTVFRPGATGFARSSLRVALHCHLDDPEQARSLIRRLRANLTSCDLFLSTDTKAKVASLAETTRRFARDRVVIRLVPDRGPGLGSFLSFPELATSGYDLIGHVHGKPDLHPNEHAMSRSWREYLWQHLLGDYHPMIDEIAAHCGTRPGVGLIFPEEPATDSWTGTDPLVVDMAARLGLDAPLPRFLNHPNGGMFWARPEALSALLRCELVRDPEISSPSGISALQGLLPLAVRQAGFQVETVHLPGIPR